MYLLGAVAPYVVNPSAILAAGVAMMAALGAVVQHYVKLLRL